MILNDNYERILIILDEENLIYKGTFRKTTIKREEIRSAFYDEELLGVLTYSGKIYSLKIDKLSVSDKEKLEQLRLVLNKENILFDYTNRMIAIVSLPLFVFFMPISISFIISSRIIVAVLLISIFIFYINVLKKVMPNNVYNINSDEVEILRGKHTFKYKKQEIDKIKLIRGHNLNTIEFKKNGNKYVMYFKESKYLTKIYSLSLGELFT
ncbi:hypothetical protein E5347_13785 [Clostridium sartagoforme]|uniref:Uncharacterized protein n=1 Tax=Clostridium sartagoforme TaxID=84031 RepID=A0A4S2DJ54_9CLOT|nr:hypothetical protein [Clostridium sartagoforme]TGY40924.1 hypothetical protein E5347_13785 [Clostridium sartagoforme]